MEINNVLRFNPVLSSLKADFAKKESSTEANHDIRKTLQDDIVTLSTSGGSHPDRPPEPKPETPPKT